MINIAHRGALKEAPENSLEAFQVAFDVGSTRIELDVHPNFDGIPYVIHDETLERTTDKEGHIRSCTVSELTNTRLENTETVPTLQQVVDRFAPQMEINVEIKGTELNFIENVAKICAPYRSQIIVSSEFIETLTAIQKMDPNLSIACLLPCRLNDKTTHELSMEEAMQTTRAKIAHPEAKLVTAEMMESAKKKNWKVFTWISRVDEEDHPEKIWNTLKKLEVDGHCTNDPRAFTSWQRTS